VGGRPSAIPLTDFQRQLLATAFAEDRELPEAAGYELDLTISQPGFIRAIVRRNDSATQIDWAHGPLPA
jgi:hypothetical protein